MFQNINSSPQNKKQIQGFTLIEVLIALFLFSIAITTIFSSFIFVLKNAKNIKNSISDYEVARNCFDRVEKDISAMFIAPNLKSKNDLLNTNINTENPYVFIGKTDSFSFPAFAHIPFAEEIAEQEKLIDEINDLKKDKNSDLSDEENNLIRILSNQLKTKQSKLAIISYYLENNIDNSETYSLKRSDILFYNNNQSPYEFDKNDNDPSVCSNIKSMTLNYIDMEGDEYDSWDSGTSNTKFSLPAAIGIEIELQGFFAVKKFTTKLRLPAKTIKEETTTN